MSSMWPHIQYRDFYDRPRAFFVEWRDLTYFFDSPFVEATDEYSPDYLVTQLPAPIDLDLEGTWEGIASHGEPLGSVAVESVEFDETLRDRINPEVFDRLGVH